MLIKFVLFVLLIEAILSEGTTVGIISGTYTGINGDISIGGGSLLTSRGTIGVASGSASISGAGAIAIGGAATANWAENPLTLTVSSTTSATTMWVTNLVIQDVNGAEWTLNDTTVIGTAVTMNSNPTVTGSMFNGAITLEAGVLRITGFGTLGATTATSGTEQRLVLGGAASYQGGVTINSGNLIVNP